MEAEDCPQNDQMLAEVTTGGSVRDWELGMVPSVSKLRLISDVLSLVVVAMASEANIHLIPVVLSVMVSSKIIY